MALREKLDEQQLIKMVKNHHKTLLMTNQRDRICFNIKDEDIKFDKQNNLLKLNVLEDAPIHLAFQRAKVLIVDTQVTYKKDIKVNCKNHKYEFVVTKNTYCENGKYIEPDFEPQLERQIA